MLRKYLLVVPLALAAASSIGSAAVVEAGLHVLLPETPGQVVAISVAGGDLVQGLNLCVSTGDGGSLFGGTDHSAPQITGVTIVGAGTVFATNNAGQNTPDKTGQFWSASTSTSSGTVGAAGTLAFITIDTTGYAPGTYALNVDVDRALGVETDFGGVPASLVNGTITISAIPEPSAAAPLACAGALAGLGRRRRRA